MKKAQLTILSITLFLFSYEVPGGFEPPWTVLQTVD